MNLAEAMVVWEDLRTRTEQRLRAALTEPAGDDRQQRVARLERRLSAIALALDVLRSPEGPLAQRAVARLAQEHQQLVDAAVRIIAGSEANDAGEVAAGVREARMAITATEAP